MVTPSAHFLSVCFSPHKGLDQIIDGCYRTHNFAVPIFLILSTLTLYYTDDFRDQSLMTQDNAK